MAPVSYKLQLFLWQFVVNFLASGMSLLELFPEVRHPGPECLGAFAPGLSFSVTEVIEKSYLYGSNFCLVAA